MAGLIPDGFESIEEALDWALQETHVAAFQLRDGERHWEEVEQDAKALVFHYSADAYQYRNRALRLWKRWRELRDRTKKHLEIKNALVDVANLIIDESASGNEAQVLLYTAHTFAWELLRIRTGVKSVDVANNLLSGLSSECLEG